MTRRLRFPTFLIILAAEMPFSVKAERKISVRDIIAWFRDTYENTIYDQTKNLIVTTRDKSSAPWPVLG